MGVVKANVFADNAAKVLVPLLPVTQPITGEDKHPPLFVTNIKVVPATTIPALPEHGLPV